VTEAAENARATPEPAGAAVPTPAPRAPARARRHMIVAAHPLAAEAGRRILRVGGSAVDAAIAAQLVLNLVEPQSSGIGGGGFLLASDRNAGTIDAYDGRETAPRSAHAAMFLDRDGKPRPFPDVRAGGRAVGVPGLVAMMELAHRKHGRLPWTRLLRPAIELAENGFEITPRLHALLGYAEDIAEFPAAAAYFLTPDGKPKPAGARLVNRPFAATLKTIARGGAAAFYRGPLAEAIVAAVNAAPRNPGALTLADFAEYEAKRREPVCLPYRKWLACGMPPPTSGGIATLQILGLIERFDIAAAGPGTARAVHLIAEASRIAFADRDRHVADPDFVGVPAVQLLDLGYLAERAETISPDRSMGTAAAGEFGAAAMAPDASDRGISTTHISVLDDHGNAAVLTSSIEGAFGSRLMVGGFLLNHQLTDFAFVPKRDGRTVANRAEAGKRPRSSMSPTLVFDSGGDLVLATGSPGGTRIIGFVAKTIVAALDWDLDIQAAVDLPNFANLNGPTVLEEGTDLVAITPALEALGHEVRSSGMPSGIHAIRVRAGEITGGADFRRDGVALGD
jgi:gamma-glutamyltranspeptidase/glutathione hydrolase